MHFCFRGGWLAGWVIVRLYAGGLSDQAANSLTSVVRTDRHSGKLVRMVVAKPGPAAGTAAIPPPVLAAAVDQIAAQHVLPPELIHSVIQAESNYNPYAVSPKGALGLMQLIPATARRFGVANAFDPVENIQGGAKYLRYLLDLYHGDYPLALAAYNAGEQAVARYRAVPPFPETQNYVVQVEKRLEKTHKTAAASMPVPEMKAPPAEPSGPAHIQEIVEPDGSVRYVSR
jgi:soluble lytic murein transglycosylase-like protein